MSSSSSKTPQVLDPEQIVRGLHPIMVKGSFLIAAAITLQYVGQWRLMAWTFALNAMRILINILLSKFGHRWLSPTVIEWSRMTCNLSGLVGVGLIAGWSLLLWSYVPFAMLWMYGMDGRGRPQAFTFLAVMDVAALLNRADPLQPAAFSLMGVLVFLLTEKRADLLQQSLEHIIQQREQLTQTLGRLQLLHDRALEQEKLSSLGMMAAGVAHEINNPMAYVTSNVHSLFRDLQRQPIPAEVMREYVEEVLPATLDGIHRVNTIVGDLRRFSRGDPETYAEYNLTTEVQAALRIAQGQLNHVKVELELDEVGMVVGRPQQIVQVLVNLLVNAGQATKQGGVVRLSTRREADGVRVEIRDTGSGMTQETLHHLFQPFFTTKPPGMGTGLGLAVVHGIVTGQGGRIEVASQPGLGSCFTIHLPRVAHRAPVNPGSMGVTAFAAA